MASLAVRSPDLAQALTRLRREKGLERAEAAGRAGCSRQTIWRAEKTGTVSRQMLPRLLDAYGVTDPAEAARLLALAEEAKQPAWWDGYALPAPAAGVVGAETGAVARLAWELTFIPGLLQTEDYARAVISAGPDDLDDAEVGKLTAVRMRRQEALRQESPLHLSAVVAEAALRTVAGGPAVMRAQLEHLREAAQMPNVTVRAVPFTAGAHPGMTGAFSVLQYRDGHDVLYYDTPGGAFYDEDPVRAARARRVFSHLTTLALSPRETIALAAKCAADL